MASPMQMMECVASALGVDLATVVSHDRNLVTAGLRTKGGRGTSAARMTSADAANLIIALAGAEQVRGNVDYVNKFASLASTRGSLGAPLRNLGQGHSFAEALTFLIQGYADGSFRGADGMALEVTLTRPRLKAQIEGYIGENGINAEYLPREHPGHDPPEIGDLSVKTTLTHVSLWQIGEILRT